MGSLLEITSPGLPPLRLYLSGDTVVSDELHEIARRHPDLDLGVLHLGGTTVFGLLPVVPMTIGSALLMMIVSRLTPASLPAPATLARYEV